MITSSGEPVMNFIRIRSLTEADFDLVIKEAGGTRLTTEGSADYVLNEAVVELKLVNEEGFDKPTRQKKIADLFRLQSPRAPVVVVDPDCLDEAGLRAYYNIVEGPIKTHVKKAASQLEATSQRYRPPLARVLVIVNVGYTALTHDEFVSVCLKCAQNDTSKIDWIVCCGVYFHSDKFDQYLFAHFDDKVINVGTVFPSFEALAKAWDKLADRIGLSPIKEEAPIDLSRMPVLDLVFDLDGVTYVKEAPRLPQSDMWPAGRRPRDNSTGIETCPAVAKTFPALSLETWKRFKKELPHVFELGPTYKEWVHFQQQEEKKWDAVLKPFVPILIEYDELAGLLARPASEWSFSHLCRFANQTFYSRALKVLEGAVERDKTTVVPLEFIYLIVREIGEDKANDLASIYYISMLPGFEREELLVENARVFFEHAGPLAASYAVKRNVERLVYTKV